MKIIGCDYHPSFQQIALLDLSTGEYCELRLLHAGGEAQRFYVGLIPSEDSSGQRRRLGAITKQGSSFLRFLLVQAAASAVKGDAEWARAYKRLARKSTTGSRRWRSRASWWCGCTGCCARKRGIRKWFACRAARVIL